jgi:hypothetical protein
MVRRFRLIDAEFRRLAPQYPEHGRDHRDGVEVPRPHGLMSNHRGRRACRLSGKCPTKSSIRGNRANGYMMESRP